MQPQTEHHLLERGRLIALIDGVFVVALTLLVLASCGKAPAKPVTKEEFLLQNGFTLDAHPSFNCAMNDPCKVYANQKAGGMLVLLKNSGMVEIDLHPASQSNLIPADQNSLYQQILRQFCGESVTEWVILNLPGLKGNDVTSPTINGYSVTLHIPVEATADNLWVEIIVSAQAIQ